jgi:type I restriction enzyme, S subunit
MNNPWRLVKLGDVLQEHDNSVGVARLSQINLAGVYSFGRGLFKRGPITPGETSYKSYNKLVANDFVISTPKAWEGAIARVTSEFDGWFLSPVFPTFRANTQRLLPKFLEWYCKRSYVWDELQRKSRGMGARRETVHPQQFLSLAIPLPTLAEQNRIVARIDELAVHIDEARSLQTQIADELGALSRAIIYDEGATSLTPMGDLVRLRAPDVIVEATETYQFAGVYSFGRGVFRAQAKSGMEFAYPKLTRLKAGNFVYPKLMAWEGALGIVSPDCDGCVVSTEFPVFDVLQDRVLPEVLDTYFRTPTVWPMLSGASTGTNVRRRRLNPADFLKYKIPLPSRRAQERLREVRTEIHSLQCLQGDSSVELDALLPAILDRAFKGEL